MPTINTIEYGIQLQKKLDEKIVTGMTSGWMEQNAGQVIYDGGNKIKMPVIETSGLKDYSRDDGYPQGSVTLKYETYEMGMDRSTSFQLDSMDVNETNFLANAASVTNEFQNTHVIPEIDSYRYSKLYALLKEGNKIDVYTAAENTVFDALMRDIADVRDVVGEEIPLVISIAGRVKTMLEKHEKFTKILNVADFNSGVIKTTLKQFDNNFLKSVPSARMKTAYLFKDGKTSGEEAGGCSPAEGAKQINWIITPQKSPIAVTKQDKMKIIDPDTYQKADAWFIGYRRYHELWLPKTRYDYCCVNAEV